MKISRIDQIALNGGDGAHYKYEEVAEVIIDLLHEKYNLFLEEAKEDVIKILVENFPNDET